MGHPLSSCDGQYVGLVSVRDQFPMAFALGWIRVSSSSVPARPHARYCPGQTSSIDRWKSCESRLCRCIGVVETGRGTDSSEPSDGSSSMLPWYNGSGTVVSAFACCRSMFQESSFHDVMCLLIWCVYSSLPLANNKVVNGTDRLPERATLLLQQCFPGSKSTANKLMGRQESDSLPSSRRRHCQQRHRRSVGWSIHRWIVGQGCVRRMRPWFPAESPWWKSKLVSQGMQAH